MTPAIEKAIDNFVKYIASIETDRIRPLSDTLAEFEGTFDIPRGRVRQPETLPRRKWSKRSKGPVRSWQGNDARWPELDYDASRPFHRYKDGEEM